MSKITTTGGNYEGRKGEGEKGKLGFDELRVQAGHHRSTESRMCHHSLRGKRGEIQKQ